MYQGVKMERKIIPFVILIIGAIFLILSKTSAIAVTPPPEGDTTVVAKPSKWRIYTPWENSLKSDTVGSSYGEYMHVNSSYYAQDFNPYYVKDSKRVEEDIAIYAIAPGRVVYAQKALDGFGNTVVLEHHDPGMIGDNGWYYSQYSHLESINVQKGDVIGLAGGDCGQNPKGFNCRLGVQGKDGGTSSGIHLHFELHRCSSQVNNFSSLNYIGCQKVIPEPMVGDQVYELWYHYFSVSREDKYQPMSWRPNNYNEDNEPPRGWWLEGTSSGNIRKQEPVVWHIGFSDNRRIKEIRATIYFENWPGQNYRVTAHRFLEPKKIWFVAAACNPTKNSECASGTWRFEWNPWISLSRDDSKVPIGWLPSKTRSVAPNGEEACISFDIFDEYGNVSYAPGGVEGSACAQLFNSSSTNLSHNLSNDENSPYRLIRFIPESNVFSDGAVLVSQTLSDYSVVAPGQAGQQIWRIRNTGSSTWGSGYKLVFREGDPMGSPKSVTLPSAAPGQTIDIAVPFQTPSQERAYASRWQLQNPQGTYFGPSLWIKVKVVNNLLTEHITLFDISPASPSEATTVHIVGRARYFQDYRSMRFRIGDQVFEQPNMKQIGDQLEISVDWQTATLERGNYAIVFEVAKKGDNDWANPERVVKTYTLIGTPAPKNRPPERPLLKSPYNWFLKDSSGSPANVELCVHPVTDPDGNAVKYYFEVKDQGGGVYASSGWVDTPCWTRSYNPNTYSWRVKSGDGSAESEWSSDTWNFTVAKGGVYIGSYQIFNPNTNDTHLCVFVTYDGIQAPEVYAWLNKAPDGSENGEWRLLDHYGPNAPPDCTQSNYHGFWIHSPEYETGLHKLRISAVKRDSGANAKIDTTYSIGYIRPSDVKILAPSTYSNNGTWWNNRTIHFEWSPSLRAQWYTLRVSTNSNPWADPTPIVEQTFPGNVTSFDYTFSQDYPKLYWSVRAGNSVGMTDSGPNVWFGIDTVRPTCVVQNLPSATFENVFQVNWNGEDNSAGLRGYDIQYRDTSRSEWLDWLLSTPISKPYELFNGLPGHIYEFRCRAIDRAGNIGLYPTQPDTSIKIDPASRPQSAWWDTSYQYKRNLIVQNNMATLELPAGYPVHLHFDNSTTPTAAEIYNASLSSQKCDDLRIVVNDTTEVHRIIQNCRPDLIDIWFRSQTNIPNSSIDSTKHQLYYGNPAPSSPLKDPNHVWYPYKENDTVYLYFFQEGSGSVAYDASGNGKNCSIDPSVQWSTSKFGRGLQFLRINNGNSRSLQCGSAIPLSSFTIEFWYKSEMTDTGRIVSEVYDFGQNLPGNWIVNDEGRISISIWTQNGGSDVKSNFNLRDAQYLGKWVHIAITFNGINEVRFYINGELDSVKYLTEIGSNSAPAPLEIGSSQGIAQIKGTLGTFRISNSVKTSFPYGMFGKITQEPSIAAGGALQPPTAGTADLTLLDLKAFPEANGSILFQALVKNAGSKETLNGFFTDLYADHTPSGSGDYTGSIKFWVNDPIAAGQIITLTTVVENPLSLTGVNSKMLSAGSEITTTIYAQTDSTGAVPEELKSNNIYSSGLQLCTATADEFEDDNSILTAHLWDLKGSLKHNIHQQGDQDWVKFSAEAGETYVFRTLNLGSEVDTTLFLYDQDGETLLAYNDDFEGTWASHLEWTAPKTGIYYLMVKNWNYYTAGCGTGYELIAIRYKIYLPMILRELLP